MIYFIPTDTCYGIACAFDDKKNYEKMYKIKKRNFEKPLAIMVESFDWLEQNTQLTDEQIDFLKKYPRPFTVITHSDPISLYLNYQDEDEELYINKDIYEHGIGFRVAHNDEQEELIEQVGPIWLTSANMAWENELYTPENIEAQFGYYLKNSIATLVGNTSLDADTSPSDVFRFTWDTTEVEYVRKPGDQSPA